MSSTSAVAGGPTPMASRWAGHRDGAATGAGTGGTAMPGLPMPPFAPMATMGGHDYRRDGIGGAEEGMQGARVGSATGTHSSGNSSGGGGVDDDGHGAGAGSNAGAALGVGLPVDGPPTFAAVSSAVGAGSLRSERIGAAGLPVGSFPVAPVAAGPSASMATGRVGTGTPIGTGAGVT